jgi:hypothetical protein
MRAVEDGSASVRTRAALGRDVALRKTWDVSANKVAQRLLEVQSP